MILRRHLAMGITSLLVVTMMAAARAQAEDKSIERLLTLVNARWTDPDALLKDSVGTGWVVGHTERDVYVVTAGHNAATELLRWADEIDVTLIGCSQTLDKVTALLETYDPTLDMIVLRGRLSAPCLSALSTLEAPPVALDSLAVSLRGQIGTDLKIWARTGLDSVNTRPTILTGWKNGVLELRDEMSHAMSGGLVSSEMGILLGMLTTKRQATELEAIVSKLQRLRIPTDFIGASGWLVMEGDVKDATFSVDAGPVVHVHQRWRLSAGQHKLAVQAAGYDRPKPLLLDVSVGQDRHVCVKLERPINNLWRAMRWPLMGTGAASLLAAVVTGVLAGKSNADFRSNPNAADYTATSTYNHVTNGLLIGAGATLLLAGVGALTLNATEHSTLDTTCLSQ